MHSSQTTPSKLVKGEGRLGGGPELAAGVKGEGLGTRMLVVAMTSRAMHVTLEDSKSPPTLLLLFCLL